jgi:hypothetical protein
VKYSVALSDDEGRGLVLLEQRAMSPDAFAAALYPNAAAHAAFPAGALARAVLLRLQRLGLAQLGGTDWQVTVPGRRLAAEMAARLVAGASPAPPAAPPPAEAFRAAADLEAQSVVSAGAAPPRPLKKRQEGT